MLSSRLKALVTPTSQTSVMSWSIAGTPVMVEPQAAGTSTAVMTSCTRNLTCGLERPEVVDQARPARARPRRRRSGQAAPATGRQQRRDDEHGADDRDAAQQRDACRDASGPPSGTATAPAISAIGLTSEGESHGEQEGRQRRPPEFGHRACGDDDDTVSRAAAAGRGRRALRHGMPLLPATHRARRPAPTRSSPARARDCLGRCAWSRRWPAAASTSTRAVGSRRGWCARCGPTVIINCAAFNDVDGAETQGGGGARRQRPGRRRTGQRAPAPVDATLVHYSTDFVFDPANDRGPLHRDRGGARRAASTRSRSCSASSSRARPRSTTSCGWRACSGPPTDAAASTSWRWPSVAASGCAPSPTAR